MTFLRRFLHAFAALAACWAAVVAATGGFVLRLGSLQISSRRPLQILAIALLAAVGAWVLLWRSRPRTTAREEWAWWRHQLGRVTAPGVMLVAGIGLYAYQYQWLGVAPLWLDEEMIALNFRDRSVADLAGPLWLGQSAPYGWLVLQRGALLAFGTGELALRLVPTMFGVATLVIAYWVGRRWMTTIGASVLVLLTTLNQYVSNTVLELKHYSADVCGALLLPALAAWAAESMDSPSRTRRALVFWLAAGAGLWFANGAMLVTPASAVVLVGVTWRRHGLTAAVSASLPGLIALASFGVNYLISARYTLESPFLRSVWAPEMAPAGIGVTGLVGWIARRLQPLALIPGGTSLWLHLWILAAAGVARSRARALALVSGLIPISAFVVAALGIVPLFERFSFWIVPALYIAVALAADRLIAMTREAYAARRWVLVAVGAAALTLAIQVTVDIARRGWTDVMYQRSPDTKQMLDDRGAVRWLMERRQPGDAIIATHLAWPAVWWYGDVPLGADAAGALDAGMIEIRHEGSITKCAAAPLQASLKDYRRALVYFGFRDVPSGFDELLAGEIDRFGTVDSWADFGPLSRVVIFDLHGPGAEQTTAGILKWTRWGQGGPLTGCAVAQPARRW